MLRANHRQAQRLYQILREHLGQSREGQELLAAFELNPDGGSDDLAAYLRQQLPEDEALARKLALSLESEAGTQQVTVVAGGQVDQIVNIARLGVLNLTVRRHLSVFRDVRQLVVFLAVGLAVGFVISLVVWKVRQPAVMAGDFNIAVAQFGEVTMNGEIKASNRAANISSALFNFLDSEYGNSGMGMEVQVAHKNMPLVREAREAGDLAEMVGADVVIYGTILGGENETELDPRFWVAENAYSPELTGQNALSKPILFSPAEAATSAAPVSATLKQRAQLLVQLTQALVYLKSKRLDAANTLLSSAIAQVKDEPYFKGKEVLYLLRSTVTRQQKDFDQALEDAQTAQQLNPTYARASLAEGNVYYDLVRTTGDWERYDLLDLALQSFDSATLLVDDAPVGAYIREKALVSIGNIYLILAQGVGKCDLSQPTQLSEACNLFQQAMDDYGVVITFYEQSDDAGYREDIQELAAIAYFGMGAAYERQNRSERAIEAYRTSATLTHDNELKTRAEGQIRILLAPEG